MCRRSLGVETIAMGAPVLDGATGPGAQLRVVEGSNLPPDQAATRRTRDQPVDAMRNSLGPAQVLVVPIAAIAIDQQRPFKLGVRQPCHQPLLRGRCRQCWTEADAGMPGPRLPLDIAKSRDGFFRGTS